MGRVATCREAHTDCFQSPLRFPPPPSALFAMCNTSTHKGTLSVRASLHGHYMQKAKCYVADPDLSNPTRHRFERPLDTIRSFEAAIDGEYKRRSVLNRAGTLDRDTAPESGQLMFGNRYSTVGDRHGLWRCESSQQLLWR